MSMFLSEGEILFFRLYYMWQAVIWIAVAMFIYLILKFVVRKFS